MARLGEGQTALVTGASVGIGVDLAECFAKDGYDLILTARSEGALKEVATRLTTQYKVKAAMDWVKSIVLPWGQKGKGKEDGRSAA